MSLRTTIAVAAGRCLAPFSGVSANSPPFCASAEQSQRVQQQYAASLGQPPSFVAAALGMVEATVLSGLPFDQSFGVAPVEFENVWNSLSEWDNAITLINRDGHEFEIVGPVHTGRLGRDKQRFDLNPVGWGMAGHIKPSAISAIFAISLPTRSDARTNGILFMNDTGTSFAVMVPIVGGKSSITVAKQFYETRQLMRGMARLCDTR